MSVMTVEGIVENGRIRLREGVTLPENAKVYVVVPETEEAGARVRRGCGVRGLRGRSRRGSSRSRSSS